MREEFLIQGVLFPLGYRCFTGYLGRIGWVGRTEMKKKFKSSNQLFVPGVNTTVCLRSQLNLGKLKFSLSPPPFISLGLVGRHYALLAHRDIASPSYLCTVLTAESTCLPLARPTPYSNTSS